MGSQVSSRKIRKGQVYSLACKRGWRKRTLVSGKKGED